MQLLTGPEVVGWLQALVGIVLMKDRDLKINETVDVFVRGIEYKCVSHYVCAYESTYIKIRVYIGGY